MTRPSVADATASDLPGETDGIQILAPDTASNTVYLDATLDQLRAQGYPVLDTDVARLHPYWYKHINVHGHYSFQPPEPGRPARRALRDPDLPDDE
jgi:hypothetical protein